MKWFQDVMHGYGQLFIRHPVLTGLTTLVLIVLIAAMGAVSANSIINAIRT